MKKKFLIVLIVLVALTFSVWLVNLNNVRVTHGIDRVKMKTASLRTLAYVYHDDNNSYEGFCDSSAVQELREYSLENLSEVVSCFDSKDSFELKVWIGKPHYIMWYVDQEEDTQHECPPEHDLLIDKMCL